MTSEAGGIHGSPAPQLHRLTEGSGMKTIGSLVCLLFLSSMVSLTSAQAAKPSPPDQFAPAGGTATLIQQDEKAGLELWQTLLGPLWIPKPGNYVIKHLEWEQALQKVYHHPAVHVRKGDIVIDCGAHIGGFTRVAISAGAKLVIAVEPEIANITAFRRNFEAELKSGKVRLVEKGVWDSPGKLSLHLSGAGDSHSLVVAQQRQEDESIEVTTLDAVVRDQKLPRVDFIKMDIEGSEKNALKGGRQTLKRWRPRLAISSYHLKGDPASISAFVWEIHPDYLVNSKDLVEGPSGGKVPKVLFFH